MDGCICLCVCETAVLESVCFEEDRDGVDEEKNFVYIPRRWDFAFQKFWLFALNHEIVRSLR